MSATAMGPRPDRTATCPICEQVLGEGNLNGKYQDEDVTVWYHSACATRPAERQPHPCPGCDYVRPVRVSFVLDTSARPWRVVPSVWDAKKLCSACDAVQAAIRHEKAAREFRAKAAQIVARRRAK